MEFKTFHTYADAEGELLSSAADNSIHHSITYYTEFEMTLDEWNELDLAMEEAFDKVFGKDDPRREKMFGLAGPIPFPEESE